METYPATFHFPYPTTRVRCERTRHTPFGVNHFLLLRDGILVLVGYLDDSGKDPQNQITTLAGYLATDEQWKAFEEEVEPWFAEFKVYELHTMELHKTKGEFEGWSVLKKQAFVARICQVMSRHVLMGVSVSAVKGTYRSARAKRTQSRRQTTSPYAWCLNWIVDNTLRSIRVGREANTNGLALILESGNEHNAEAEKSFYEIRDQHKLEGVLRSISFVPKQECRAIQIADLVAFYSRRHGVAMEKALCVPKTSSELMAWWNRLSWRNDRAALFISGRLGLTIQVEVAA